MQPLNDHIEDLIRRAAQDYPLDTSGADWQQVEKGLSSAPEPPKGMDKRWFLLLLLLPLGLVCNHYFNPAGEILDKVEANVVKQENTITPAPRKSASSQAEVAVNEMNSIEEKLHTPSSVAATIFKETPGVRGQLPLDNSISQQPETIAVNENLSGLQATVSALQPIYAKGWNPGFDLTYFSSRKVSQKLDLEFYRNDEGTSRAAKFYFGIAGGLDATTIRFQKIDRTGNTFGILAGYNLSRKFSVETGVFSTKKYYYTEGEYFDKSKLGAPSSWIIKDVDGNCRMLEIPLSIRYSITPEGAANWFAAAGVRSYFMQEENYEYMAIYSGGSIGAHEYTNKEGATHLAANISISGGFQKQIGKIAGLRIEPFVQVPLKPMGVGNLRFVSGGLQVAVTRDLK